MIERVILSAGAMLIFSVYFHLTICPEGRKDILKVQYNPNFGQKTTACYFRHRFVRLWLDGSMLARLSRGMAPGQVLVWCSWTVCIINQLWGLSVFTKLIRSYCVMLNSNEWSPCPIGTALASLSYSVLSKYRTRPSGRASRTVCFCVPYDPQV